MRFCQKESASAFQAVNVEEVPGKGLKGTFKFDWGERTIVIGNEAFMQDHNVVITNYQAEMLQGWKARGESVALAASLRTQEQPVIEAPSTVSIRLETV